MKISKILSPFLAFLILNLTLSTNFILKATQNDRKLSNYICKITKDITKAKNDTQDVLIGNSGGKLWSSTESFLSDIAINSGAFTRKGTVYHHMTKVLIVVPSTTQRKQIIKVVLLVLRSGIQNIACVHETLNGSIQVEYFSSLMEQEKITIAESPNASVVYPDKLKNMEGYAYQIAVFSQLPRVVIMGKKVKSSLTYLIDAINRIQNSTVNYAIVGDYKKLQYRWNFRLMDLTFNTGLQMITNETELLTYEERSYCAIIPLPPKVPIFQSIFIEPFDGLTWLFFVITIFCSVAVWLMFRGRGAVDSPWLLGYGMFVMFIGQGVEFSRKNRLVLTILLQLIIIMIWILSNAYEGVITSFMIQPIHEQRLETFDDLVASNYKIITSAGLAASIDNSEAYRQLKPRLNTSGPRLGSHFAVGLRQARYVFILNCDEAEMLVPVVIPGTKVKVSELYYMLPQKIYPHIVKLPASFSNPFLERLQYYMDLSFQAGLPYIWTIYSAITKFYKKNEVYFDEFVYLTLDDLTQVFSFLTIGFVLSAVILVFEIFFHDILKQLKLANQARKLRNRVHQMAYKKRKQPKDPKYQHGALYYIIHRHKRVKRLRARKLKVRSIYVQPRFPMD
ncbi:unnamed protein product [Chironomus riparius]|uniref:Ionotropic receptor n=1 Tax=Chironomus riparius TaxID=315576 RepID=A0A9N9S983_9DIPT|nr:unnamed protein product [Chironomus riparius]